MATVSSNSTIINTLTALSNVLVEEDGDSRDSGISMTSNSSETDRAIVNPNIKNTIPSDKLTTQRHALVDCSNLANKILVNNASRNSSFYTDTPTGRKTKSVLGLQDDSLDQSLYDKQILESQLSEHRQSQRNQSESFELEDSGSFTRKRSNSTTSSSTSLRKRSRTFQIDPSLGEVVDDDYEAIDDDAFLKSYLKKNLQSPVSSAKNTFLQTKALFNMDETQPMLKNKRNALDDSFNGSFNRPETGNGQVKPMRTMSVGALGSDRPLPSFLEVKYRLPSVEKPQKDSQAFRSISPLTLLQEFDRLGDEFYSTYIIVDCRYPYEYDGGHVKGAINVYCQQEIEKIFFPLDPTHVIEKRVPIFYCEFSQKRGPSMATKLRSVDRVRNELSYPNVEYPEIYLVDYGYRSLWSKEECRSICEPRSYVPMDKPEFVTQLRTFRGARLRSSASVKSCSDLSISSRSEKGSLRKLSHRNLRKHSSFLSIHSNLSNMSNEDVFTDSCEGSVPHLSRRSISAFNISSVGSEVDIDVHLMQKTSTVITSEQTAKQEDKEKLLKALELFKNDGATTSEDITVKLGLRIESPHFVQELENAAGPLVVDPPSPRTCLNFSDMSDNE